MIEFINNFNLLFLILFTILYSYQGIFMLLSFFLKDKKYEAKNNHKYAIIIPARNEAKVIANLMESIRQQNYPIEYLDIYVIADNCTDNTSDIAKENGAKEVYIRKNNKLIGKGYALKEFFTYFKNNIGFDKYEAYFMFDADNLLDENYMLEMNKVFDAGYKIVTSYRNPKNFGDSWISAGSGTWFLRDCVFMNKIRMCLGTTSNVTGTGFMMSKDILEKNYGWKHLLLTEDIEFSIDMVIQGEMIAYANDAIFYDEQPTKFVDSWNQRMRWVKGFYQVLSMYGWKLVKRSFIDGDFGNYDMFMLVAPGNAMTLISVIVNFIFLVIGLLGLTMARDIIGATAISLLKLIINVFFIFMFIGIATTISEWKRIKASKTKKILNIFTFPIFMLSYIPISLISIFKKVKWVEIEHTKSKKITEIK